MNNKTFYWLVCIGLVLFASEAYLFYGPQHASAQEFLARVFYFRNDVSTTESDILVTDDPGAHEEDPVIVTPEQSLPTMDIVVPVPPAQEPPATVEMSAISEPQSDPIQEVPEAPHVLKTPGLVADVHQYPQKTTTEFPAPKGDKSLQFVIFAFDGSRSLNSWNKTLAFGREMRQIVEHFSYTYFLNPVYLLTNENKSVYMSPYGKNGSSAIGFGGTTDEIKNRITMINQAIDDGHDVQSHAVGHWDGSKFSTQQWQHELNSFQELLFGMGILYPGYDIRMNPADLVGFRAPELGVNNNLYGVLHDLGYRYDTSRIQTKPIWPTKDGNGIWQFPLDIIKRGTTGKNVLAMDYNFYFVQTNAKNTARRGTPEWDRLYQETLVSYQNYFQSHYDGNRAPVYLANHFGFWNDGLYWEVMKQVARETCVRPDVFCGSYKDLLDYMDQHPELEGLK